MSYYANDDSWPARQSAWDQQQAPSRSGATSALSHQSDGNAFASQFEEIERATDNLLKSGKWFPNPTSGSGAPPPRRDSVPGSGRSFEYGGGDPRMGGGPSRHQSISEYDGGRPGSAGLQGFYQGQRFPGRQNEAEQMLQAKRRMAAQRERELRNYHQEQQYNRSVKTDRSMSPTTMSEEDRRELIARQHRALYGDNSSLYGPDGSSSRQQNEDARGAGAGAGGRGASPLTMDPYGVQAQAGAESAVQMPPRDRTTSNASPASAAQQQTFGLLNEQNRRTSTSSPGGSPPAVQGPKGSGQGVAPIGTRPIPGSGPAGALSKRSTTPLTPSSLSYGFSSSDAQNAQQQQLQQQQQQQQQQKDERSTSAASNPPHASEKNVGGLGGWGGNSTGVWGSGKGSLGVQASVWG